MDMPFELHIALRYLLAKRKQAFISVISLISTLGVTVGVMALVIALALMTGLQQELRDRILGVEPAHLRLEDRRHRRLPRGGRTRLRQVPHVVGAAPAILGQGARQRPARRSRSSSSRASIPALEREVTDLQGRDAERHASTRSTRRATASADGILLGKDLARASSASRSATRCRS